MTEMHFLLPVLPFPISSFDFFETKKRKKRERRKEKGAITINLLTLLIKKE